MIVPPNGCAERAGTISSFVLLSSSKVEVIAINIMHQKVAIRIAWQLYSLSRYTLQDRIISGVVGIDLLDLEARFLNKSIPLCYRPLMRR